MNEQNLRQKLGIPTTAQHVLIFAESSHWDPDWMYTAQVYFDRWVRHNLDQAIKELLHEPRRVYSIECMFFLRMYWEVVPEQRETLRQLINNGRLRLTSSGVTTADTLLPKPETLLRDFLIGQEWLSANGMIQEPRLAYFPDSFGCTHALPALLNAAGFDRTAITRLDGMQFPGCDFGGKSRFYQPETAAGILKNRERSLDFIWRDRNGGEVLCHWNAYTYGQGDMLAHGGLTRLYLFKAAYPRRSARQVAGRIRQFTNQLLPYSRTPYLFCPIGFDFVEPIPDLVTLLDHYNQETYPQSGIWVQNAGLDDYLDLVECYRDQLPVLELDPNPYWTGFYTARPGLKKRCRDLADALVLAEGLALMPENAGAGPAIHQALEPVWDVTVASNHHDFITGTSPDHVVENEQIPWLDEGLKVAREMLQSLKKASSQKTTVVEPLEWHLKDGILKVDTPHVHLELAEEAGGCLTDLRDPSGMTLLSGISNDVISYYDTGGLWRMGQEFPGGKFRESGRSSSIPSRLQVRQAGGALEVTNELVLDGMHLKRRMWLEASVPAIRFQLEGLPRENHTLTARFETGIPAEQLTMDEPGGVKTRPMTRRYHPTFWPFQSFVVLQSGPEGRGVLLGRDMPGAATLRAGGALELVTHRNAVQETAWGVIHFPGNPARGHEREAFCATYALAFLAAGTPLSRLPLTLRSALRLGLEGEDFQAQWDDLRADLVELDPPEVILLAAKTAARQAGIILRLGYTGEHGIHARLRLSHRRITAAFLCDARERDLGRLAVQQGWVYFPVPRSIITVRVSVE